MKKFLLSLVALVLLAGCATVPVAQPVDVVDDGAQAVPIVTTIETDIEYVGFKEVARSATVVTVEWSAIVAAWTPAAGGAQPTSIIAMAYLRDKAGKQLASSPGKASVAPGKKPYLHNTVKMSPDDYARISKIEVSAGYVAP